MQAGDAATARMSSGSDARGATKVAGDRPATATAEAVKSSAQRCVWKPQARWTAMPSTSSRAAAAGRAFSHTGGAKGVWLKCTQAKVGTQPAQAGSHEAQVVVLHEHGGSLGRHLGHGVGKGVVHGPVGVPGRRPRVVEGRLAREIPQAVVGEPEHLVAHHVVGQPVGLWVEGEQADVDAVGLHHAGRRRFAVAVGHGGGQPGGTGLGDEGADARHEPTGAAPAGEVAVGTALEGDRAAVRDEDDRPVGRRGGHARPR